MYSNHPCPSGSKRSALELVIGQHRQAIASSMIGSVVFAEIPDSVAVYAEPRFIPAAYLGRAFLCLALLVQTPRIKWRRFLEQNQSRFLIR